MLPEVLIKERELLAVEVADLEKKRLRLELIDRLLETYDSKGTLSPKKPTQEREHQTGETLTARVVRYLSGRTEACTPREIGNALKQEGLGADSNNFFTLITNICKRQESKGVLELVRKDGRNAYLIKGGANQP